MVKVTLARIVCQKLWRINGFILKSTTYILLLKKGYKSPKGFVKTVGLKKSSDRSKAISNENHFYGKKRSAFYDRLRFWWMTAGYSHADGSSSNVFVDIYSDARKYE